METLQDVQNKLLEACIEGSVNGINNAVKMGADVCMDDGYYLLEAAKMGHVHVLAYLDSCGCDLNRYGREALGVAMKSNENEVVSYLLKRGKETWAMV